MFFSIIIPTYNPRKYLPDLLTSISRNECKDDIEIIISDDCSNEPFEDILQSFNILNIKVISNKQHKGFPRDGRQNGADHAIGEWITFVDQDDLFIDNAFDKIKESIIRDHVTKYLITDFIMRKDGTDEYTIWDGSKGWTHGKFYEKSFWDEYNLGYDDISYCEDINLSTKLGCIMIENDIPAYYFKSPIYIWNRKDDSLSEGNYLAESMPDYIKSTLGIIIKYIEKFQYNHDMVEKYNFKFMQTLYHIYFYFQSKKLIDCGKVLLINTVLLIHPLFEQFKKFNCFSTDDIINKTSNELSELYAETRYEDYKQLPFIEWITFKDWIKTYFG